jgi:dienelactone hydrolase
MRTSFRLYVVNFLLLPIVLSCSMSTNAQDRARDRTNSSYYGEAYKNTFGKFPAKSTFGDRMIADFFHLETKKLSDETLSKIDTLEDWRDQKDVYRQQLLEMLSLDPMPARTDLNAIVTGTLDRPEFTVEKIHFQSRPGLYVTGNVYVPKGAKAPSPAILYVCGHGPVKIDNISYGNKATYQHHGAWFARNGYVCLIIDSVQLGELEGIHHGTHNKGMWWWNSRGYTSAGAEAWNCIRALDYLQSRPDVDGQRIGVTGRSGGGAYSWWVAALDERIQAACPVAGITDLQNHVDDGCVEGHCDCMYMVNTYRWDYVQVAALVSPRPLLICNTDKDRIFPLDGVVRLHSKVRRIYDLHNASDKLGLVITEGPHKDTQELQVPVMRWFNKWLKKEEGPVGNYAEKLFAPQELKVFPQLPSDEVTTRCYESFTSLANDSQSFDPVRAIGLLRTKTFGAWPQQELTENPMPIKLREIIHEDSEGVRLSVYEFESQPGILLRFYLAKPIDIQAESLHLEIVDDVNWLRQLELGRVGFGTALKEELQAAGIDVDKAIAPDIEKRFKRWMKETRDRKTAYVTFTPRGVGITQLGKDDKYQTHVRRRFMLLGSTLASSQVWDMHRASQSLRSLPAMNELPLHFHASPEMTEVATFAALFEDKLTSLSLPKSPRSDQEAPDFLNWSRFVTPAQLLDLAKAKTRVNIRQESKK